VDGERILKLLPETSCAVPEIGVEISLPPGTVTGEGETPGHPAKDNSGLSGKEKSGATGKEETPSHRCGGNPGPPGIGQTLGPLVSEKARCHPGKRGTRKEEPRATGAGKTSKYVAEGKPRVVCGEESSGPSAKGKLQVVWRRGNPELRNEKKALSHPAKGKLEPFGLGETPVNWQRKALSHWLRKCSALPGLGETPGSLAKRKSASHGAGSPEPPGDLVATGAPGAFLALVGGRAAQRTLRNRRERAARLGEAPVSHTYRGLVPCLPPLCPTGQNRGRTDTPPRPGHSRPRRRRLRACNAVRRRRYRSCRRPDGRRGHRRSC
jgi:hypothetical protein